MRYNAGSPIPASVVQAEPNQLERAGINLLTGTADLGGRLLRLVGDPGGAGTAAKEGVQEIQGAMNPGGIAQQAWDNLVRQTPEIAATLAPGAAARAAVLKALPEAATAADAAGAAAQAGSQSATHLPDTYDQSRAAGMSPLGAAANAAGSVAIDTVTAPIANTIAHHITGSFGLQQLLRLPDQTVQEVARQTFAQLAAQTGSKVAQGVASGAIQGVIQSIPQQLREKLTTNPDLTYGEAMQQILASAGAGAVQGGVAEGVSAPIQARAQNDLADRTQALDALSARNPDRETASPDERTVAASIDQAAAAADPAPTEAQKEAGNYAKGHVRLRGMDISIENPAGSERTGVDRDGNPWSVTMPAHYGYVRGTEGADGDHVDVYIGPKPLSPTAYVVDQVDADTGDFDEHKAMLGFPDEASALQAYDAAFSDGRGPERRGAVTAMPIDEFKTWAASRAAQKPLAELPPKETSNATQEVGEGLARDQQEGPEPGDLRDQGQGGEADQASDVLRQAPEGAPLALPSRTRFQRGGFQERDTPAAAARRAAQEAPTERITKPAAGAPRSPAPPPGAEESHEETTPGAEAPQGREGQAHALDAPQSHEVRLSNGTTVRVSRQYDVPLGGGTSRDGRTVYLDPRLPVALRIRDGTLADVDRATAEHEMAEKPAMDAGKRYQDAHDENANPRENAYLRSQGIDPAEYNAALKPHLDRIQASGKNDNLPPDLEPKPYVDSGLEHLLQPEVLQHPGKQPVGKPSGPQRPPPPTPPRRGRAFPPKVNQPSPATPAKPAPAAPKVQGPVASALWGERSLVHNDIVPTARAAAEGLREAAHDIRATLAPQTAGKEASITAGALRQHGAELALRSDRIMAALGKARAYFQARTRDDALDFIDRMETGRQQETPELEAMAQSMRDILDSRVREIQQLGTGKLQHYIEDYFPHIWKDPEKAASVFQSAAAKRPLEGNKGFLKQRTIPTVREGLERGLELESENPVDLVALKAREMDKYLLGQRWLKEMKAKGLATFVRATDRAPEGYAKIDDKIGQVYGPPTITTTEHVEKNTYDALTKVLSDLGVSHERVNAIRQGVLGESYQGQSRIRSRANTPLSVIAHELGHQLDAKLGLGDLLKREAPDSELAAIADLHGTDPLTRGYFQTDVERTASVLEAWIGARDRMEASAPKTTELLGKFFDQHPELAPLKELQPSLQYEKLENQTPHGGLLKYGEYYMPEAAAQVANNYLSPGLRGKSGLFRGYMGMSNFLNQAQLGLSAFHLGFTSLDATTSKFAVGLMHLADGNLKEFGRAMAATPTAAFTNFLQGSKVLSEWYHPGSQGGDIAKIVDAIRAAGGRAKMDAFYQTTAADRMMEAFRKGNVLGGLLRLPGGAIDLAAKPIMDYLVPRQKLGVFADMARRELARLPPDADQDTVRAAMAKAWDSVDNRMGQLVYDNLFWHKAAKDLSMASVRSLGWNLGTIRELGGGMLETGKALGSAALLRKPEMTYRMSYIAALPIVTGILGATLNYLFTGKGPQELKDYFFPRTGDVDHDGHPMRVSLPSYMKDVYEYAHAPINTLASKLHPAIGAIGDMLHNRDFYGTEIRHPDDPIVKQALQLAEYAGKQLLPFGVRNAQQEGKEGVSTGKKVAGFFGVTKAPYWMEQSKAEQLAAQLVQDRMPQGTRTQEQADASQAKKDLVNQLRDPDPAVRAKAAQTLAGDVKSGAMSLAEAKALYERVGQTTLQHQVHALDVTDALKVFDAATEEEKHQIGLEVAKKILSSKTITASQRALLLKPLQPYVKAQK